MTGRGLARSDTARTVRRALRVGFYAALARVALGLVKTVLLRRTLRARAIADAVLTLDPCKWACVLGGWALFPAVRAVVAAALRAAVDAAGAALAADGPSSSRQRLAVAEAAAEHTATAVAGAAAALPVLVMNVTTRTELGLYLAARALHGAAVTYLLPALPDWLGRFPHWEVVGVAATGGQILYGLGFAPDTHSRAYEAFLLRCVFSSRHHFAAASATMRGQLLPSTLALAERLRHAEPVAPIDAAWVLPGDLRGITGFITRHLLTFALPLYLPLKAGLGLALHGPRVVRDPVSFVAATLRSALRSSLFLTLYCAGPIVIMRGFMDRGLTNGVAVTVLCGVACSLPTFLEPKSRRLDLALYCVMHALRSARLLLYQRGYLSRPTRHQVLAMYVASVAFLFHQHTHTPETLHPNLEKGMRMLAGVTTDHNKPFKAEGTNA